MNLQKLEVIELSLGEQKELDAGGWIRDAVASVIGYYTCGCHGAGLDDFSLYLR